MQWRGRDTKTTCVLQLCTPNQLQIYRSPCDITVQDWPLLGNKKRRMICWEWTSIHLWTLEEFVGLGRLRHWTSTTQNVDWTVRRWLSTWNGFSLTRGLIHRDMCDKSITHLRFYLDTCTCIVSEKWGPLLHNFIYYCVHTQWKHTHDDVQLSTLCCGYTCTCVRRLRPWLHINTPNWR